MNQKRLGFRVAALICAAIGWWSLLYPELTLTPETVKINAEQEDGTLEQQTLKWNFEGGLYLDLLNAGPENISFRSKLFTNISSLLEAFHDRDKIGNDQ